MILSAYRASKLEQLLLWLAVGVAGFIASLITGSFWIKIDSEPNDLAFNELLWAKRVNFLISIGCFLVIYKLLSRCSYRLTLTAIAGSVASNLACIGFVHFTGVFLIDPFKFIYFWRGLAISLVMTFLVACLPIFLTKGLAHFIRIRFARTDDVSVS